MGRPTPTFQGLRKSKRDAMRCIEIILLHRVSSQTASKGRKFTITLQFW